jgi:hypothetical protein
MIAREGHLSATLECGAVATGENEATGLLF